MGEARKAGKLSAMAAKVWLGVVVLAGLTACAAPPGEEGVACAAPSLFVTDAADSGVVETSAGGADLTRLDSLQDRGCALEPVLAELDNGDDQRRLDIAHALWASGYPSLAVSWFEQADSFAGYARLLELHAPGGALADDAAYLRYEVKRAQLQQAFGEEVAWPVVSQAQPLFVSTSRSALYADTDLDSHMIESLSEDERLYLLEVVVLEDGESYWVQAYYPAMLALGWVPAETVAQYPREVRERLADLDNEAGREYAQQLLFSALLEGMSLSNLEPLATSDFFGGAQAQQRNTMALLQRLGQVTDQCLAEVDHLEQSLAHYLMGEGPPLQPQQAPYSFDMRRALAALTRRSAAGLDLTDAEAGELRQELGSRAHEYFRIRVQGQVDQRLCHSLPNAAGDPAYATPACTAVRDLQSCVNRVDAIFKP